MPLRLPADTVLIRFAEESGPHPDPRCRAALDAIEALFRTRGLPVLDVRRAEDAAAAEPATIRRTGASAFVGTDLEARLEDGGHTTLVFVGGPIEDGLASTVRHAADLGFRAILPVDACHAGELADAAGRRWTAADVLAVTLAELGARHAALAPSEAVIAALNRLRRPRFSPPGR